MSERIDRRIGNNRILTAVLLIMLVITAATGIYSWMRISEKPSSPVQVQSGISSQSIRFDDPIKITILVPGDDGTLLPEQISLSREIDAQTQAREALIAALANQHVVGTPLLGRLKLRAFFLDEAGTGYVDLVPVSGGGIESSAREELLAIYAIVNMLSRNFEEIRQVRFLLDGREAQTLAGHIDLSGKFAKRVDLEKH
jgi:hypothetical protein